MQQFCDLEDRASTGWCSLLAWDTPCKASAACLEVSRGVGAGAPWISGEEHLVLPSHALFGNVLLQERVRCVSPENPAQANFSLC